MSRMKQTATPPKADNVVHLHISKKERRRAEDKYTPAVIALGYTVLPTLLLKAQAKLKLTPIQLNVLLHIIEPWWDADRLPWIAKDAIAQRMRKSPRSVQRAITQLVNAGHLKRVERFLGRKQQTANAYELDGFVKKLVALVPEFKKAKEQNRLRKKKVEAA
jgi:hypothetical protein